MFLPLRGKNSVKCTWEGVFINSPVAIFGLADNFRLTKHGRAQV